MIKKFFCLEIKKTFKNTLYALYDFEKQTSSNCGNETSFEKRNRNKQHPETFRVLTKTKNPSKKAKSLKGGKHHD